MNRVTLICEGLPTSVGEEAARDIAAEFAEHRQWHSSVTCEWRDGQLILRSDNDFDETGEATLDEFGDCVIAYIADPGDYKFRIESVSQLEHENA